MRQYVLAILALAVGSVAFGQNQKWIGHEVVTKYGKPLKDGDKIVDDGSVWRIYTVKDANGTWLRLVSGGIDGWLQVSDVVPYENAIRFYTEEINDNSSNADAYARRALIWCCKGQYDVALADSDEAIRLDPSNAFAYYGRATLHGLKMEHNKAISDYTDAIRLNPKYTVAYINRARAWKRKEEYAKALVDFGDAIRLDPKDPAGAGGKAWLLATCPDGKYRDGKAAVELANTACELSKWSDPEHLDTLAAAYAEFGEFEKAAEMERRAVAAAGYGIKYYFETNLNKLLQKVPIRDED